MAQRKIVKREVSAYGVVTITWLYPDGHTVTSFGDPDPPRRLDETPIQYRKRTGRVDVRYFHVHKGWYYCNPAHCKLRWRDKLERDKHLDAAYSILG